MSKWRIAFRLALIVILFAAAAYKFGWIHF